MLNKFLLIIFTIYYFSLSQIVTAGEIVNFAVLLNSKSQEQACRNKIAEFEQLNPTVKVRLIKFSFNSYSELHKHFILNSDDIDVVNWYAGKRMKSLVKQGAIVELNDGWTNKYLTNHYSQATIEKVTHKERVYGIPFTSYVWGIFYKKALFARLQLDIPTTWQAFLSVLKVLHNNQISPIGLGTKFSWQSAGWFDYLMLRVNGASKYQALVQGQLPYTSPEVREVFTLWKQLIDSQFIFAQHRFYDGSELMPLLYREVIGVNLSGSFSLSELSNNYHKEIGFFPFPAIHGISDNSVLAPMSVLSLTKAGSKKLASQKLIQFFSQKEVQSYINERFTTISPIKSVAVQGNEILLKTHQALEQANYLSQYFDREVQFDMAEDAKLLFTDFIQQPNVDNVTRQLEQKRIEYYQNIIH